MMLATTALRVWVVLLFAAAAGFIGCSGPGDSGAPGAQVTVRDSAGVEIVEFSEALLADLPRLVLSAEPVLSIGALEGDVPYIFARLSGARVMPDGGVAVLERRPIEVRVFDSDGVHVRTLGREGQGPGELRIPGHLQVLDDGRLAVHDNSRQRMIIYAPETGGVEEREFPQRCDLPGPGAGSTFCGIVGLARSGGALLSGVAGGLPTLDRGVRLAAGAGQFWWFDGANAMWLDSLESAPTDVIEVGIPGEFVAVYPGPALFHPHHLSAVGGGRAVLASTHRYELRFIDGGGIEDVLVRMERPLAPVTEADLGAVRGAFEQGPRPAGSIDQYLESYEPGDSIPVIEHIRVASDGRVWVADYEPGLLDERVTDRIEWTVHDPDGRPVARAITEGIRIVDLMDIAADRILVRERDEFDVQYLRVYAIEGAG